MCQAPPATPPSACRSDRCDQIQAVFSYSQVIPEALRKIPISIVERAWAGAKARLFLRFTARLKSCPDTEQKLVAEPGPRAHADSSARPIHHAAL